MIKDIVVSGIQPSGELHLGNYLGAIRQWITLQETITCFFFIVDWHSLTENYDPQKKRDQIFQLAVDLLALGLNPQKCTVAIQSDIKEHAELAWILQCVTPVAELERMTQYKDKSARQEKNINTGLLTYPVLQAADILLYDTTQVPVGEDQIQHVELARVIARKFNKRFGETFIEPKVLLTKTSRVKSLLDPTKKMSKSLGEGHYIALRDDQKTIEQKIRRAVTDTGDGKRMSQGVENLFGLLKEFGEAKTYQQLLSAHKKGTLKYSELKPAVADAIATHFAAFRAKVLELGKKPDTVWKQYASGARAARAIAEKKIASVRANIGLR